jgi:hypothetical protein
MNTAWHLILVAGYSVGATCLGVMLQRLLAGSWRENSETSPSTWLMSAFLLGQGSLANLWILLALGGLFTCELIAVLLLLCVAAGGIPTWRLVRACVDSLKQHLRETWRDHPPWRLHALTSVALVSLSGVATIVMPLSGDAVAYYMAYGKLIAGVQRLQVLPGCECFFQLGLQGELHWGALISLGASTQAKCFAWPTALAGAVLLLGLASQANVGVRGRWILLTILFSTFALTSYIWDGKVDVFGASLGMACFYWVFQVGRTSISRAALSLAGTFATLAVLAKLSLLIAMLPGVFLLLAWRITLAEDVRPGWMVLTRRYFGFMAVFALWALIAAVPHLLKNSLVLGEPFAPFFFFRSEKPFELDQIWFSPAVTRHIISIYPFALVFGLFPMMGGTLSPLVLAFLPLVLLLPRPTHWRHSVLVQITLVGLVGVVLWMVLRPSVIAPRYILPTLMLLMIPAARGAEWVSLSAQRKPFLGFACLSALFVTQYYCFHYSWVVDGLKHHSRLFRRGTLPESTDPCYRASLVVNDSYREGDRLWLGMYFRYWVCTPLLVSSNNESERDSINQTQWTPQERWQALHAARFHYLILDWQTHADLGQKLGVDRKSGTVRSLPENLRVVLLFHERDYSVFAIQERQQAPTDY